MFQISLKAARVNSDLKQDDVVKILKEKFNIDITRQRLSEYEKDATEMPVNLAKKLTDVYGIPEDNIFFGDMSTLSYTFRVGQRSKQEVG